MGSCCAGCTCEDEPVPSATIEPPTLVTEGWQMDGLASQRKNARAPRRSLNGARRPILRPIDQPVEWTPLELCNGIAMIEVRVAGDEPDGDAYVKVLGVDPKGVYAAWQRVADSVSRVGWFYEEPF